MIKEKGFLPITVDKSHLITIGERLYSQSIELIRELVNNAYDADATEVKVNVSKEKIIVEDNGTGMDKEGLKQYFSVGSREKIAHPKSPKFKRDRIGQFGIGKFAALAAAKCFEVYTQSGDFAARVIFDKENWEKDKDGWLLPLEVLSPDRRQGEGTKVVLSKMTQSFDPLAVEHCVLQSVPLKAKDFDVYLNGHKIKPKKVPGHRLPLLEGTPFGVIYGEIVIVPSSLATTSDLGVEVKVRQVTIKRELFGMETWGKDVARIKGEVYADFLPITSDRNGFITDSKEYQAFLKVMDKIIEEVRTYLKGISGKKESRKTRAALKESLQRIQKALRLNPDFSPSGLLPLAGEEEGMGEAGFVPKKRKRKKKIEEVTEGKKPGGEVSPVEKVSKPRAVQLTPKAVVQRLKVGESGINCGVDHYGEEGEECFSEGTTIFINQDHPLYLKNARRKDTQIMHITRLLTQEISLMKDPLNPRQAYERQSKLLRDAFVEEKKKKSQRVRESDTLTTKLEDGRRAFMPDR